MQFKLNRTIEWFSPKFKYNETVQERNSRQNNSKILDINIYLRRRASNKILRKWLWMFRSGTFLKGIGADCTGANNQMALCHTELRTDKPVYTHKHSQSTLGPNLDSRLITFLFFIALSLLSDFPQISRRKVYPKTW